MALMKSVFIHGQHLSKINKLLPSVHAAVTTTTASVWSHRALQCKLHTCCHMSQRGSPPCSQQQADTEGTSKPWRLASAVCLERFPVVSNQMNEIERRYFDMVGAVEFESSALSEHELSVAADKRRMAKKQSGAQDEEDEDDDGGDLLTALDLEDLAAEELARFNTAPRTTADDEQKNMHSLNRKLMGKLVLLVKRRIGDESVWLLPYGLREEGETMKDAAVRVLSEHSDDSGALKAHFMGNAPVGFYKQRYPKTLQNETGNAGVKVFFFKAQHISGVYETTGDSAGIEDYSWVDQEELDQYLEGSYLNTAKKFILPS